ncbi:MAG: hypothetical protein ACI8UO_002088 [Verrucomicrobiales bacterium]|jgi:hypothetical protein
MMIRKILTIFLFTCGVALAEPAFEPIFDGKSLKGWEAKDMGFWTIKDGAITATSSAENPCKKNQFLIWQGGDVANFVLRLKFRLEGSKSANSGIQVRSAMQDDGAAVGYQADITFPDGKYLGAVYDEHTKRKTLATRGQRTVIGADGSMKTEDAETPEQAAAGLDLSKWTDYEITFIDNKITIKIGGKLMSEVVDNQKEEAETSGLLMLQLHSGPPMMVQFKDIELKKLP